MRGIRMKKKLVVGALVAAAVVGGAGVAVADPISTPDDLGQGGSAVTALLGDLGAQLTDFVDGPRPEGVDGTEVEPVDADPRFVEGPLSGIVQDGPFE
ncbi:hypothetical protein GCM10017691_61740 [Pseudonocardia petroleophila]|uniref:Secreted protein n=1 Tax=Pseudonocardia petroleophila TaxID=37331 RepID=A0A7G7MM42_9PSEU|nr:hypothetical protein [Pseudonocardia petroleophila]QNG53853.1 hypothetical protein H6H00_08010 [Pseudonocardia petroleophila]